MAQVVSATLDAVHWKRQGWGWRPIIVIGGPGHAPCARGNPTPTAPNTDAAAGFTESRDQMQAKRPRCEEHRRSHSPSPERWHRQQNEYRRSRSRLPPPPLRCSQHVDLLAVYARST